MEDLLKTGQLLDWSDAPFLNAQSVHSVFTFPPSGILHASRPFLPVLTVLESSVKPVVTSLKLLECLRSSEETYAAVWLAKAGEYVVCVKFYCEHAVLGEADCDDATSTPEDSAVMREAAAYTKLRDAQGSIVPWSYGFYKVSTFQAIRQDINANVLA
jgi:hypothetical protein